MPAKSIRNLVSVSAAALLVLLGPLALADPASKWRIEFDHWAEVDGELVLRIAPAGGTAIDVPMKISKGTSVNAVADLALGALKAQLGKGYKLEVDDGEDVIIKRTGKTPKFEVTMTSNSVTG